MTYPLGSIDSFMNITAVNMAAIVSYHELNASQEHTVGVQQ